MAWLRRVNENNVDLNRNFLASTDQFAGAPEAYRKLNRFLNPEGLPKPVDLFLAVAFYKIVRHGFRVLKRAVAGGQYEFPSSLFSTSHSKGPALSETAAPQFPLS